LVPLILRARIATTDAFVVVVVVFVTVTAVVAIEPVDRRLAVPVAL
jgi:hypothetical protein